MTITLIDIEWMATLLGLAYVVLAARHNLWAWPAALLSASIYSWILWQDDLTMQALLHLYYVFMAIWGWLTWQRTATQVDEGIQQMSVKEHLLTLIIGAILSAFTILVLSNHAGEQIPLLDSITSVYALIVTWLVVKQKLENWLYWIAIDSMSAYLFLLTNHYALAILYVTYTLLAVYGYVNWRKKLYQKKVNLALNASQG